MKDNETRMGYIAEGMNAILHIVEAANERPIANPRSWELILASIAAIAGMVNAVATGVDDEKRRGMEEKLRAEFEAENWPMPPTLDEFINEARPETVN